MKTLIKHPASLAFLAAVFFGASAPLSKLLLGSIEPIPLAAFLYLGSGIGSAFVIKLTQFTKQANQEASLARTDLPWLAGAVLAGGVAAPILLMVSLNHTPAATASLLLNFEGIATVLIAVGIFKEPLGKKAALAVLLITLASIILSWNTSGQWGFSLGSLGILAACTFWGIDNNFTRNISAKNPQIIVMIKGLFAGGFSLLLAIVLKIPLPAFQEVILACLLGYISYGLSITLFILALRQIGAARTSLIFSAAPFIGFFLSILLVSEPFHPLFMVALPFMILGTWFLLTENHSHAHHHPPQTHAHNHNHIDEHHHHEHPGASASTTHAHPHHHAPLTHTHPHNPDIHHQHDHAQP